MELESRTSVPAHATGAVEFVDLSAIADDATFRLREEGDVAPLASSLGRLGQLVPVELRPLPSPPGGPARFQIVAGFRRVAALRLLRRETVLARVHHEFSDEDAWGLALSLALLTEPLDRTSLEALRERLAQEGMAPWAEEFVDEGLVRAPVEPELRERFLEFLDAPPGAATPTSDEVGLDGHAGAEDEPDVAALDGARGAAGDEDQALDDRDEGPGEEQQPDESEPEDGAPEESPDDGEQGGEPVEVTPEELAADLAAKLYDVNQDLALAFESWEELPRAGRRDVLEQVRWIADLLARLEGRR